MLKVKACYVTPIIQHLEFVKCEYKHEKKYISSKKKEKNWPTPSPFGLHRKILVKKNKIQVKRLTKEDMIWA